MIAFAHRELKPTATSLVATTEANGYVYPQRRQRCVHFLPRCRGLQWIPSGSSRDNASWSQTAKREASEDGGALYRFQATADRVWLAAQPPFLSADADALLERIARETLDAERFVLARTREDRPVHGIKLGGGTAQQPAPLGIWMQARQHAWEAGSSWVARGFLEWSASDDPAAVELRRIATIYAIPIMDVDNVTLGAGGKEAVPRDHNRDWDDRPVYPEVAAAGRRIRELDAEGRLHVFLDLHAKSAKPRKGKCTFGGTPNQNARWFCPPTKRLPASFG